MSLLNIQNELADLIFNQELSTSPINRNPYPYLDIYRHNICANLMNTLSAIYPLVSRIVGLEFFRQTANEYIKHYPARSSNLHDYGEYFSDFLSEYAPAKHLIYLPEVASFEWIHHILYFAEDHPGLDLTCLANISADRYGALRFMMHPASFLKKFNYPILRIIELCQQENEIETSVNLAIGGIDLLMIRRDLEVMLCPLTPPDFALLNALAHHQTLSQALQAATEIDADFNLTIKLPEWVNDKTLVDCFLD